MQSSSVPPLFPSALFCCITLELSLQARAALHVTYGEMITNYYASCLANLSITHANTKKCTRGRITQRISTCLTPRTLWEVGRGVANFNQRTVLQQLPIWSILVVHEEDQRIKVVFSIKTSVSRSPGESLCCRDQNKQYADIIREWPRAVLLQLSPGNPDFHKQSVPLHAQTGAHVGQLFLFWGHY